MLVRNLKRLVSILLLALVGCSKGGGGEKMSGDVVPFALKCATARGATPSTNGLPHLEVQWTYQSSPLEDIIVIPGRHFDEVQAFLKQAFGEPDSSLGSFPVSSVAGSETRQGVYGVKQIGIGLIFSVDSKNTIICIVGSPKP